jgi:hypothetical protein
VEDISRCVAPTTSSASGPGVCREPGRARVQLGKRKDEGEVAQPFLPFTSFFVETA